MKIIESYLDRQNLKTDQKKKFISHEVMLNSLTANRKKDERPDSELVIDQKQTVSPV